MPFRTINDPERLHALIDAILLIETDADLDADLVRQLCAIRPELQCLMPTSLADTHALDASSLAGSRGYVLKNMLGDELIASLRRVTNGGMLLTDEQAASAKKRLHRQGTDNVRFNRLSPQERRILDLLGEGLSNREIADVMFLAEKTVKNYVSHLLAKLSCTGRTEAALYAQRHRSRTRLRD